MRTLLLLLVGSCVGTLPTATKTDDATADATSPTGDTGETDGTNDTTRPDDPDDDNDGFPVSEDCNDLDDEVYPGALEVCDGKDNDCDRLVDDQAAATVQDENFVSVNLAITEALLSDGTVRVCPSKAPWPMDTVTLEDDQVLEIIGVAGRDETTLLSPAGDTLFRLSNEADLSVDGITLTGATLQPAIVATGESRFSLVDGALTDNLMGGVAARGAFSGVNVFFTRSNILRNSAGKGNGGAVFAELVFDVRIIDSMVDGNSAVNGGVVYAYALAGTGSVTIEDSEILNNSATGNGGAVYLERQINGTPTLSTVTAHFMGNSAGGSGGAIYVQEAPVDLETTVIEQNSATSGAGIFSLGSDIEGDGRSDIIDNIAVDFGGGVSIGYGDISEVLIQGNRAGQSGGGVYVSAPNASDTYEDVAITGNTADNGGGVYVGNGALVVLDSCTITENSARTKGTGGGVFVELDTKASLRSESSSWGTPKVDDNSPDDVYLDGPDVEYSYDGSRVETFECSITTKTCD